MHWGVRSADVGLKPRPTTRCDKAILQTDNAGRYCRLILQDQISANPNVGRSLGRQIFESSAFVVVCNINALGRLQRPCRAKAATYASWKCALCYGFCHA